MAKTSSLSFRGGSVSPGQGINEGDIHPLQIERELVDGTPDIKTYDPLQPDQTFRMHRLKFVRGNGDNSGSYDPYDNQDKTLYFRKLTVKNPDGTDAADYDPIGSGDQEVTIPDQQDIVWFEYSDATLADSSAKAKLSQDIREAYTAGKFPVLKYLFTNNRNYYVLTPFEVQDAVPGAPPPYNTYCTIQFSSEWYLSGTCGRAYLSVYPGGCTGVIENVKVPYYVPFNAGNSYQSAKSRFDEGKLLYTIDASGRRYVCYGTVSDDIYGNGLKFGRFETQRGDTSGTITGSWLILFERQVTPSTYWQAESAIINGCMGLHSAKVYSDTKASPGDGTTTALTFDTFYGSWDDIEGGGQYIYWKNFVPSSNKIVVEPGLYEVHIKWFEQFSGTEDNMTHLVDENTMDFSCHWQRYRHDFRLMQITNPSTDLAIDYQLESDIPAGLSVTIASLYIKKVK